MRQVARTNKPTSLQQNATQWTQDLLKEVKKQNGFANVSKTYKDRYRKADVQESLRKMYMKKCCYCETIIGIGDFEHIEHRKPKALSAFHHLAFEWSNLHWACSRCNQAKGDKWDNQNLILDAAVDNPENFLELDLSTCHVVPKMGHHEGRQQFYMQI